VVVQEGRCQATWKRGFKLPWRGAGPPNHHDDKVDPDQYVVNKELSLSRGGDGWMRGGPRWVQVARISSTSFFFFFITLKPRVERYKSL